MKNNFLRFNILSLRQLMMVSMMFLMILPISAQLRSIHGIVIDQNGEPIIGANIIVTTNTTRGTITDIDGNFELQASPDEKLRISYIGYIDQIIVAKQTELKIVLKEDSKSLEEVVVVGYGIQKKASLTGSVSAINSEKLTSTPNENVVNMLAGKLPGIRVRQYTGEPGAYHSSFDIRGMGAPLIVINGVPSTNDEFNRLNPNDIDQMSVLKDGAAAIYGVQAANGVVLVTTKKGSSAHKGKVDISYTFNQGYQFFQRVPEPCDVYGYMTIKNEIKQRRGSYSHLGEPMATPEFTDENIEMYRTGKLVGTDWSEGLLRNLAPQSNHNISLNGSTDRIDYYFNIGYMDQSSLLKSNSINYDRWNFNSNAVVRIMKGLKADVNLSGFMDEKNRTREDVNEIFKMLWMLQPTVPRFANNNPLYPSVTDDNKNPYIITDSEKSGYEKINKKFFQGQFALEYEFPFVKGLKARAMYNYKMQHQDYKMVTKQFNMYTYDAENDSYIAHQSSTPSQYQSEYVPKNSTMLQTQLSYNNTFAHKHTVSATMVYEEITDDWDHLGANRYLKIPIYELFAGSVENQKGWSNGRGKNTRKSWVGRFTYDYASKYMVDFAYRYDGSSKFSPKSRWGFFPSISGGWRLSEEKFIKENSALSFINNLKIRGSYGVMGDDAALAYQYLSGYTYPNENAGYNFNNSYILGLLSRGVANPDLTWYKSKTWNVGMDATLWNGKLNFSFDYFSRDRTGLLARRSVSLPGTVGIGMPEENLNSDRSRGWELSISHHNSINGFVYDVSANISSTRTQNRYVESTPYGSSYDNWRNNKADRYNDIWWGTDWGGQFQNYDQIMNHEIRNQSVPGDHYYEDWNGDGVIDKYDQHPIGIMNLPLINYGINASASYKGFDIDLVFQGTASVYTQFDSFYNESAMWGRNSLTKFMDRWHTKEPNANMFDPETEWIPGYFPTNGSPFPEGNGSTRGVKNSSYLRLKSAEIGYTLPHKLLEPVHIQNLRLFVSGYNLFTITGLRDVDPEHPSSGGGDLHRDGNFNTGAYPINSSFNVGATITF